MSDKITVRNLVATLGDETLEMDLDNVTLSTSAPALRDGGPVDAADEDGRAVAIDAETVLSATVLEYYRSCFDGDAVVVLASTRAHPWTPFLGPDSNVRDLELTPDVNLTLVRRDAFRDWTLKCRVGTDAMHASKEWVIRDREIAGADDRDPTWNQAQAFAERRVRAYLTVVAARATAALAATLETT